ncbi:MAG: hypothetical protein AAF705_14565, partial [Bacteroidota bacterium]
MKQKYWEKGILWLICLFLITPLFAQYNNQVVGNYTDKAGNTKEGIFNLSNLTNNKIVFYPAGDLTTKKILDPANIQEIEAAGATHIITHTLIQKDSMEALFLVALIKGNATLYEGYSDIAGDVFFIKMSDRAALIRVNRIGYQRQFNYLFGGCSPNPVGNPRYSKSNLMTAFKGALECLDPNQSYIVPENSFFKTKIGIYGRLLYGAFDEPLIKESLLSSANLSLSRSIGFGAGFRLLFDEHLSLDLGLEYTNKELSVDDALLIANFGNDPRTQNYNFLYSSPLALTYDYFSVPLIIRYSIPIARQWELSAGMGAVVNWVSSTNIAENFGAPVDYIPLGNTMAPPSGGGPVFNSLIFAKGQGNGANAGF